jgi:hypothetical protein
MDEEVGSHDVTILTGENRSTGREICTTATSSTTNPTCNDLGMERSLGGERPATISLSRGKNWHLTVYVHHQVFLRVISEL